MLDSQNPQVPIYGCDIWDRLWRIGVYAGGGLLVRGQHNQSSVSGRYNEYEGNIKWSRFIGRTKGCLTWAAWLIGGLFVAF